MRQKPSRIADSAVAEAVRRTRLSGSERLPSVTSLAAASGVAPVTVMRAIRRLEARGKLRTVRRPGTYLLPEAGIGGRPPDTSAIADRRARRWETIAGMLIADINARRYEPGARMPSHKELCARYGTSFLTIKKALRLLTDRKIVVPFHTSIPAVGP